MAVQSRMGLLSERRAWPRTPGAHYHLGDRGHSVKIAFDDGEDLLDLIIKARTNSEYSHCEFLFSDGMMWSSVVGKGTRFATFSATVTDNRWTIVDVGTVLDEPQLRAWCEAHVGEKYGIVGDFCFLWDVPDFEIAKPFCSQALAEAARAQGVWTFLNPSETTPGDLYLVAEEDAVKS